MIVELFISITCNNVYNITSEIRRGFRRGLSRRSPPPKKKKEKRKKKEKEREGGGRGRGSKEETIRSIRGKTSAEAFVISF